MWAQTLAGSLCSLQNWGAGEALNGGRLGQQVASWLSKRVICLCQQRWDRHTLSTRLPPSSQGGGQQRLLSCCMQECALTLANRCSRPFPGFLGFPTCSCFYQLRCSVLAWEPVPQFRALLSFNLAANKLAHLVTVRERVVADNPGGTQVCGRCVCQWH